MQPLLFFIALLAFIVQPASAEVVTGLHRASVEVEDHSERQLQRASRSGLKQVLLKLSGSRSAWRHAEIVAALDRSQRYLQQYQYRQGDDGELLVDIQFNQNAVTELLVSAGQPVWTVNRPPVLVWAVVDAPGGRRMADPQQDTVHEVLREAFSRRGVPVVFPLLDLQDSLSLSVHDLWQLDDLTIHRASQRYNVEHILVARLTVNSDQLWMADWLYLYENETAAVSEHGKELQSVVFAGVELAAESMALNYAVAPSEGDQQDLLVRVDGLDQYLDYRAVLSHLRAVELVSGARLAFMHGNTGIFRLRAQMQPEQLQQVLLLRRKLSPQLQFEPLQSNLGEVELVFQWSP